MPTFRTSYRVTWVKAGQSGLTRYPLSATPMAHRRILAVCQIKDASSLSQHTYLLTTISLLTWGASDMQIKKMWSATWFLIGLFAIGALGLPACSNPIVGGTSEVITQEMDFEDFDKVAISDAF